MLFLLGLYLPFGGLLVLLAWSPWSYALLMVSGSTEVRADGHLRWDRRGFSADAEHRAHDDFTRDKDAESDQGPVPGLGDEAIESFTRPDSSGVWGEVIVRRANVIIEVRFGAKPGDQVPATAERVARVVVARLTVT